MPVPSLKIGLIGAGRIGQLHARHLTSRIPSADLLMVADVSVNAANQCANRFAIPSYVQDYHALLDQPGIEAVLICSSTDTHAHIIEEAAQAGKHIFCEKPIALNLPAIDQALQAVAQANVKLQVGFNRRFDANFLRVRQAIINGEIGSPHQFHIVSRDPVPPPIEYIRVSGGLFLDMAIHDFDMVRFLLASEAAELSAIGSVLCDPAIEDAGDVDTAVTTLRYANGIIGTISNSRQAVYGYDQRVEVLGSAGAISIDNNYHNTATISNAHGISRDRPQQFFLERYAESFVSELTAFVNSVLYDKPVSVTGHDGRMSVVMALAAQQSLTEHRAIRLESLIPFQSNSGQPPY